MYCNPNYRSQGAGKKTMFIFFSVSVTSLINLILFAFPSIAIPVDIAINAIIAMSYQRSRMPSGSEYYCNLTDYTKDPLTWGETIKFGKEVIRKYPMSQMLWFPSGSIKSNYYHHLICSIFFHYLPAYFIDFMLILFRQKPL